MPQNEESAAMSESKVSAGAESKLSRERFEKWAINGDWEEEDWEKLYAAYLDTVEYWKSRAETAELKVLTFHEEIQKLRIEELRNQCPVCMSGFKSVRLKVVAPEFCGGRVTTRTLIEVCNNSWHDSGGDTRELREVLRRLLPRVEHEYKCMAWSGVWKVSSCVCGIAEAERVLAKGETR